MFGAWMNFTTFVIMVRLKHKTAKKLNRNYCSAIKCKISFYYLASLLFCCKFMSGAA